MALTKEDLQQIKGVVTEAVGETVSPYFNAIQRDFTNVYEKFDDMDKRFDRMDGRFDDVNGRLDKIESLINDDYKKRIEKLEDQVVELRGLSA